MDQEKDKFQFVNDEPESFLLEDDETAENNSQKNEQILIEKSKKKRKKRIWISAIVMLILSLILFGFGLFWQDAYDLMAICDSLWLTFAIEFTIGWVLFVYNKNIFSPLIHGVKTFGLMLVGKRPKQNFYDYTKYVEENPIPSFYFIVVFISAAIILIPAVTLMILLM